MMTILTTLPADGSSVRRARGIVEEAMASAGCTHASIDDARLLTSELATNAVRHGAAAGTYDLTVRLHAGVLHVGVADGDSNEPALPQQPASDDESGRGLWLLDHVASRWGVDPAPSGKCVWFELPCPAGDL